LTILRYRIQRGPEGFGSIFCFVSSSNCLRVGYPFEILFWALPRLLDATYENRNRLTAPPQAVDKLAEKIVPGNLFASNKELETELMERYKSEFPEGYKKHFG